jgi:hypothetical protein
MTSLSASSDDDLEAQREVSQPHRAFYYLARYHPLDRKVLVVLGIELGGGEIHEMTISPSIGGDTSRPAQPVAIGASSLFGNFPPPSHSQCDLHKYQMGKVRFMRWASTGLNVTTLPDNHQRE